MVYDAHFSLVVMLYSPLYSLCPSSEHNLKFDLEILRDNAHPLDTNTLQDSANLFHRVVKKNIY